MRSLIDKRKVVQASSAGKLTKDSSAFAALYEGFRHFEKDLRKLQSFVEINATGFRKILKKWDKRSKSTTKELYLARQVEVQPVFNREFIAELSDVAAANILELENLLVAGRADGWEGAVDRPRDPKADGIASDRLAFGVARQTSNTATPTDVEMDVIEYEELEANLTKAVEQDNRDLVAELLKSLPIPADPAQQSPEVRGRLARILWRAALGASDLETDTTPEPPSADGAGDSRMTILTPSTALTETELIPPSRLDFTFVDDINGRSCLHEAAGAGRVRLVRQCVEHDVAVSSSDVYGRQPLHYAAMNGHPAVCSLLLSYGADPYAVDHDGFTPLIYAVTRGKGDCVRTFLDNGVQLGSSDHTDLIPLSLACQYGHYEIALLMLQRGAQIVPNQEGMWPQHLAAREGHAAILRLLIEAGADVDLPDKYSQWTPLFHAASEGHAPCVRVLLEAKCDIQPLDDVRKPPIHYAAWQGHIDCVNLLLQAGGAGRKSNLANQQATGTSVGSASAGSSVTSDVLKSGSMTTGSSADLDEMDLEGDMIPSLSLPPPIIPFRIYGHTYLDKKALVQLFLGHPNTSRASPPPIRLYGQPQLSSLKLVMTGRPDTMALAHSTILPLEDEREVFTFSIPSFDPFSLEFEIFPTFGTKIMGKAVTLPSTFADIRNQAQYVLPIVDSHLRVIGEVAFEVNVVKPFEGVQLSMGGRVQTYWKATANMAASASQGGEAIIAGTGTQASSQQNTSVVTASSLSGEYARIIVQVTRDHVPVAYPLWTIPSSDGIELAISDLTLAQLTALAARTGNQVDLNDLAGEVNAEVWAASAAKGVVELRALLGAMPTNLGVNLELRYPTRSDISRLLLRSTLELNEFVDSVLNTVYMASQANRSAPGGEERRFVLSSFNPVVCTALNWKQPNCQFNYPLSPLEQH